jgi:hypothetical protein
MAFVKLKNQPGVRSLPKEVLEKAQAALAAKQTAAGAKEKSENVHQA